jgi:hypothetical protein
MSNDLRALAGFLHSVKRKQYSLDFGALFSQLEDRYNIMEYRRHREARSVDHKADHEAVVAEQIRLREILAPFAKKDRWNFDESALFAFAPPDRGLATQQSSGEKKSKFRITLGFACNADGSEKSEIIFIGKWKQPQCFGKLSPNARGFDYHHNKAAWMTSEIFEQ